MIRKAIFVTMVVIVMLLSTNKTRASESVIVNGSFEDDGYISDITNQEPNGWTEVNLPAGQFLGWVFYDWVTDGGWNLTFCSDWHKNFEVNDIATIGQWVNMADVNDIVFDLKLFGYDDRGYNYVPWDPNKRTVVILIDGNSVPIWNSDDSGPDANDEYYGETVNISGLYDDGGLHKLSLGIKVDVNEPIADSNTIYYTFWDAVGFDLHCGGNGFLAGDFSRDCYVDMNDLGMLVAVWSNEVDPNDKYNLSRADEIEPYGIINFADFAIFTQGWDANMVELKAFAEVWLDEVEQGYGYNLYRGDDVHPVGMINFLDFAVFAGNWMVSSYD